MDGHFIRLLSIDPGSVNLGIAILDIHLPYGQVYLRHAHTFHIETHVKNKWSNYEFIFGVNAAKIKAIEDIVCGMAIAWEVHDAVSESPYMGRFPRAFEVLTQCMSAIRLGLSCHYGDRPIFTFDPATVKKAVGVKGTSSDKLAVALALQRLPNLVLGEWNINYLDEHSTDAIAVGYTYVKNVIGGIS